jgi:aminoglycoside phosphotransferase family enzyme
MEDDKFKEYFESVLRMRRITQDELVNSYLTHAKEIAEMGFIAFVIAVFYGSNQLDMIP